MVDKRLGIRSVDRRTKAIEMRDQGSTMQEIARCIGVTGERVRQYLRDVGKDGWIQMSSQLREDILKCNGMMHTEIAQKLSIPVSTVRRVLGTSKWKAGAVSLEILKRKYLGKKFNMLEILELHLGYKCTVKCDCGNIKEHVNTGNVVKGLAKSCGCLKPGRKKKTQ